MGLYTSSIDEVIKQAESCGGSFVELKSYRECGFRFRSAVSNRFRADKYEILKYLKICKSKYGGFPVCSYVRAESCNSFNVAPCTTRGKVYRSPRKLAKDIIIRESCELAWVYGAHKGQDVCLEYVHAPRKMVSLYLSYLGCMKSVHALLFRGEPMGDVRAVIFD